MEDEGLAIEQTVITGYTQTYIKKITLGGRVWKENFLHYDDLAKGNVLDFKMEN